MTTGFGLDASGGQWYIATSPWSPAERRSIFWWQMFFNNSYYIASLGAPILCFFWTSCILILQTYLLIKSISLCFDPWIFCHLLATQLFPEFWLFLLLFLEAANAAYCEYALSCATHVMNNNFWNYFYANIFWCVQEMSQIFVTRFQGNWSYNVR